jgi:hypothetical protein
MLAAAPDGPLHGGAIVIKDEWPLPWRAQRFGAAELLAATAPGESGPLQSPARRRRGRRRRRQHARARRRQHRQRLRLRPARNPWTPSAARGVLQRPRLRGCRTTRRGRRSAPTGSARCASRRLLRPDRPQADLRPLGDGGPPHGAVTTLIVSGPLCADAADCRLLGSVLFGEELAAGDAAGLRIGVVRDAVSEDVAPEVARACEAAIEALRARPAARCARSRCPTSRPRPSPRS